MLTSPTWAAPGDSENLLFQQNQAQGGVERLKRHWAGWYNQYLQLESCSSAPQSESSMKNVH